MMMDAHNGGDLQYCLRRIYWILAIGLVLQAVQTGLEAAGVL